MNENERKEPFPGLRSHKATHRFFVCWEKRFYFWPTGTSRAVAQSDYHAMRDAPETAGPFAF